MAVNAGHMTKLEAVNEMLWSIGESPVQSLASGLGDAAVAEAILDRVNREVQLKGWHVNTLRGYELTTNASNQFVLGDDTLKVDTVNAVNGRASTTPRPSAYINAVMRRSADDTKWLLYDMDNHAETWSDVDTLAVDIVQLLDFADLTPALQVYVWTLAARRFQQGAMGSQVVFQFTEKDVREAELQAVQEDSENEDLNIIRDNYHVRQIAFRNNPGANT